MPLLVKVCWKESAVKCISALTSRLFHLGLVVIPMNYLFKEFLEGHYFGTLLHRRRVSLHTMELHL